MVDFKKDTWMYILIAAVLVIISLFTPIASDTAGGITFQYWWTGAIAFVDGGGYDAVWMGFNNATLWTMGISAFCAALLLFYGLHGMKGMEFKWDWLVTLLIGITLIIFPILMLVYDSDPDTMIGFAPIGILISGIICVVVFVLEKFMGD